jgi:PAS domain-containing protein
MLAHLQAMMQGGEPCQLEMQMKRQDGSAFWAYAFMYAINAGRAHQDTIWILDDRSAQKAAEEATKKVLLEQKAILDNASVGILFTKAGLMMNCNPRMAEMFGYTREEMTGLRAVEVFPSPEMYAAVRAARPGRCWATACRSKEPSSSSSARRQPVLVPRARQGGRHRSQRRAARSGSWKTSPMRARP